VAAGVGLLLGIFLCHVREYFDDTIQNERDIEDTLHLPFLTIVPRTRDRGRETGADPVRVLPIYWKGHPFPEGYFAERIILDTRFSTALGFFFGESKRILKADKAKPRASEGQKAAGLIDI
jgi:hypothetical protein